MLEEQISPLLKTFDTDLPINGFHDGKHDFLSNFYLATVEYNGLVYPSAEHGYQVQKSSNNRVQQVFTYLKTPSDAKILGRAIKVREDWNQIKLLVMFNIVFAKFNQHSYLATKLRETGNRELIEANHWNDEFWGVCNGVGENHLGKILMKIREQL